MQPLSGAYELEADRIAEEVLAAPGDGRAAPRSVQRHASETSASPLPVPDSVVHVLEGPGRPLEPALRRDMEQRFGRDLSNVRVHVDGAAAHSAREVDARAYTVGDRIVFGAGEFAPGIESGRRLLAHDVTHTLQQSTGVLQRKGGWPDASTKGRAWNDPSAKKVGTIWRMAIAGLKGGTKMAVKDGASEHSQEAAAQRRSVLIPAGFDPEKDPVEVLLHFHGHTEAWRGQYAGYR